jgi:hypothetical protein
MIAEPQESSTRQHRPHRARPSGVYVINTKRYKGKIEVVEPLFARAKLKINERDRTRLLGDLHGQVAHVKGGTRGL